MIRPSVVEIDSRADSDARGRTELFDETTDPFTLPIHPSQANPIGAAKSKGLPSGHPF